MNHPANFIDLTGQKFNHLVVLGISGRTQKGQIIWECKCDCGCITQSVGNNLKNGRKKSCGCMTDRSFNKKHGMTRTRIYSTWLSIKKRCYNPNNKDYYNYGGRGIEMCQEWKSSFVNFYDWAISNGYNDNLTIERKDNNKDYCPDNCKWIPMSEQSGNRRICRMITYNGKTQNLHKWCEEYGLDYKFVWQRIFVLNWDFEKAISTPKKF